jgi:hypothetical protein
MANIKHNKYYSLYLKICNTAKQRKYDCYTEIHHILPRSMGGDDSPNNLVVLSSREHFICHYLLTKFTLNDHFHKMVKAFNMMNCNALYQQRYVNSKLYEANRKHMSKVMSISQSGSNNSQFGKVWISNPELGKVKKVDKSLINEYYEQGWMITRSTNTFSTKKQTRKRKLTKIKNDSKISLIHPLCFGIITIKSDFVYHYLSDGWVIVKFLPSGKGSKIVTKNYQNARIPTDALSYFVENGWQSGLYNPNHRGTSGKTYKWIDGKKIFNKEY